MNLENMKQEPTIVYNSHENSVAECQNQILVNYIHTFMANSDLPIDLWPELLDTAAYLQNYSPTKPLRKHMWQKHLRQKHPKRYENKTLFEALYHEKPDLSHLKTISCQVWALIPIKKYSKFDLRSSNYRMLGYAASTQYILY